MFRGKHQPPLTPSFFLSYYLIPSPTCLSTVNNTGPAVGARHLLLPGSWLVIGRRSDKQTLSRLVRVLTATHSQFSSALTQLGTALALCCAFLGGGGISAFLAYFKHIYFASTCACPCVPLLCLFCSLQIACAGTIKCSAPESRLEHKRDEMFIFLLQYKPHPPV